jgi:hypothetical protein
VELGQSQFLFQLSQDKLTDVNGNNNLNTNSYISLGLLVSIIGATWIIAAKLNAIERMNDKLDYRMTTMETHQSRPDPWTGTDQLRWTVEFGQLNPTLRIPEPKHFRE